MATLYVTEFKTIALYFNGIAAQMAQTPEVTTQTVSIGGSTAQSSAFNANTSVIRVHTDAICSILIGSNPTATAGKGRMAANQTEYFGVNPGDKIAVITNS